MCLFLNLCIVLLFDVALCSSFEIGEFPKTRFGSGLRKVLAQGKKSGKDLIAAITGIDANKDGVMDLEEFVSAGGSKREFARMDTNNDGVLDLDEIMMAADYAALDFDQYDYKAS